MNDLYLNGSPPSDAAEAAAGSGRTTAPGGRQVRAVHRAAAELRRGTPVLLAGDPSLVVLTAETDSMALRRLLDLPVDGVLSKKDRIDLIPVVIVAAMAHERYVGPAVRDLLARDLHAAEFAGTDQRLSAREHEVLALYASGLSVTEIAARLGRSIKTISAQKCSAMKKLSLSNDIELFRFATGYGIGLGVSL